MQLYIDDALAKSRRSMNIKPPLKQRSLNEMSECWDGARIPDTIQNTRLEKLFTQTHYIGRRYRRRCCRRHATDQIQININSNQFHSQLTI